MVHYPGNQSFHISLTHVLRRPWPSLTAWKVQRFRQKRGYGDGCNWSQRVTRTSCNIIHLYRLNVSCCAKPSPTGIAFSHSQVGITLGRGNKMDHCKSAQQGRTLGVWGSGSMRDEKRQLFVVPPSTEVAEKQLEKNRFLGP